MTDKRDQKEWQRVEKAIDESFNCVLEFGGTLSGEHGIALTKAKYMVLETNSGTLGYCRRMKPVLGCNLAVLYAFIK